MNILEMSEKMEWRWKNKSIPLKDLHKDQLLSILTTLRTFGGNWHGHSTDSWISSIKIVLRSKMIDEYDKLSVNIYDRRLKGTAIAVNTLITKIFKYYDLKDHKNVDKPIVYTTSNIH